MNDVYHYTVAPARSVLICLAAQLTGYSIRAIEAKIERGDWEEGKVWHRAPDGRIHILMEGYHRWAAGTRASRPRAPRATPPAAPRGPA